MDLGNQNVSIFGCQFEVFVEKAKVQIKFPCNYFLEWKASNGKIIVSSKNRHQANKSEIIFNQNLNINVNILYDKLNKKYIKKESLLMINLISKSRPDQIKLVGRVMIDLAEVLNSQTFCDLTTSQLQYCSVDATINFKVKAVSVKQSTMNVSQLDRSSFNEYMSFQTHLKPYQQLVNRNQGSNTHRDFDEVGSARGSDKGEIRSLGRDRNKMSSSSLNKQESTLGMRPLIRNEFTLSQQQNKSNRSSRILIQVQNKGLSPKSMQPGTHEQQNNFSFNRNVQEEGKQNTFVSSYQEKITHQTRTVKQEEISQNEKQVKLKSQLKQVQVHFQRQKSHNILNAKETSSKSSLVYKQKTQFELPVSFVQVQTTSKMTNIKSNVQEVNIKSLIQEIKKTDKQVQNQKKAFDSNLLKKEVTFQKPFQRQFQGKKGNGGIISFEKIESEIFPVVNRQNHVRRLTMELEKSKQESRRIMGLTDALNEIEGKYMRVTRESEEMRNGWKREKQELLEKMNKKQALLKSQEREIVEKGRVIERVEGRNMELQRAYNEKEEELNVYRREIQSMSMDKSNLQEKLKSYEQKLMISLKQMKLLREEGQVRVVSNSKRQQVYEGRIRELQNSLELAEKEIGVLKQELEIYQSIKGQQQGIKSKQQQQQSLQSQQVRGLRQQLAQLRSQNQLLCTQIKFVSQQNKNYLNRIQGYQKDILGYQKDIQRYTKEVQTYTKQMKQLLDANGQVKDRLCSLQSVNQHLNNRIEQLSRQIVQYKNTISQLGQQTLRLKQSTHQYQEVQKNVIIVENQVIQTKYSQQLIDQLKDRQQQLVSQFNRREQELRNELQLKQQQIMEIKQSTQQLIIQTKQQQSQHIQSSQHKQQQQQQHKYQLYQPSQGRYRQKCQELQNTLIDLNDQISHYQQRIKQLTQQLNNKDNQLLQLNLAHQQIYQQLNHKIEQLNHTIEQLNHKISQLNHKLSQHQQLLISLNSQIEYKQQQLSLSSKQLQQLQHKHQQQLQQLQHKHQQQIHILQHQLQQQQLNLIKSYQQNQSLKKQCQILKAQSHIYQSKLQQLHLSQQKQIQNHKIVLTQKIYSLQIRLEQQLQKQQQFLNLNLLLNSTLQQYQNKLTYDKINSSKTISSLNDLIQQKQSIISQMETIMKHLEKDKQQIEEQLITKNTHLHINQQRLKQTQQRLKQTYHKLSLQLQNQQRQLLNLYQLIKTQRKQYKQTLSQKQLFISQLQSNSFKLETQIQSLNQQISSLNELSQKQQSQLNQMKSQYNKVIESVKTEHNQQVDQYEERIRQLQNNNTLKENESIDKEMIIVQLQKGIESLKSIVQQKEQQILRVNQSQKCLISQLQGHRVQIEKLRQESNKYKISVQERYKEYSQLESTLIECQQKRKSQILKLQQQNQSQISKLHQQNQSYKLTIQKQTQSYKLTIQRQTQQRLNQLKQQNENKLLQINQQYQQRIQQLQQKNLSLIGQNAHLTKSLQQKQSQMQQKQSQIQILQQHLNIQIQLIKSQHQTLVKQTQSKHQTQIQQIQTQHQRKIQQIQTQQNSLKQELNLKLIHSQQLINTLNQQISQKNTQIHSLNLQNTKVLDQLNTLKTQRQTLLAINIKELSQKLKSTITNLTEENLTLKNQNKEIPQLERALKIKTIENNSLKFRSSNTSQTSISTSQFQEINKLKDEQIELLKRQNQKIKDLQLQLYQVETLNQGLYQDIQQYEEEKFHLHSQLNQREIKIAEQQEEIRSLTNTKTQMKEKNQQLSDKLKHYQNLILDYKGHEGSSTKSQSQKMIHSQVSSNKLIQSPAETQTQNIQMFQIQTFVKKIKMLEAQIQQYMLREQQIIKKHESTQNQLKQCEKKLTECEKKLSQKQFLNSKNSREKTSVTPAKTVVQYRNPQQVAATFKQLQNLLKKRSEFHNLQNILLKIFNENTSQTYKVEQKKEKESVQKLGNVELNNVIIELMKEFQNLKARIMKLQGKNYQEKAKIISLLRPIEEGLKQAVKFCHQ